MAEQLEQRLRTAKSLPRASQETKQEIIDAFGQTPEGRHLLAFYSKRPLTSDSSSSALFPEPYRGLCLGMSVTDFIEAFPGAADPYESRRASGNRGHFLPFVFHDRGRGIWASCLYTFFHDRLVDSRFFTQAIDRGKADETASVYFSGLGSPLKCAPMDRGVGSRERRGAVCVWHVGQAFELTLASSLAIGRQSDDAEQSQADTKLVLAVVLTHLRYKGLHGPVWSLSEEEIIPNSEPWLAFFPRIPDNR